jgi:penicillin-binding protein 2
MSRFFRGRSRDPEIAPDEIFLDASNLPAFDRSRLEGRLEKPISQTTYRFFVGGLSVLFLVLASQAWNLEVRQGVVYAEKSERNVLRPVTIFADRGAITDRNGTVLVSNKKTDSGYSTRVYPTAAFSSLLGYVSYPRKDSSGNYYDTDITGLAGVEKTYNAALAGENGSVLVEEDSQGHTISQGSSIAPVNGSTLTLSIDSRAQLAFYHAIKKLADQVPFSGGTGILMDVNTGEIHALISYPEFDPNIVSAGAPSDAIASYAASPEKPYLDRPIQGLYAPGSTVKPLEAAGALTDKVITPDTVIVSHGSISLPNPYDPAHPSVFLDWKDHGALDLRQAIAWSSDVYFYEVGGGYKNQKGLGIDRLAYWFRTFGFMTTTGIALPGENSGFVPTPDWKEKTYGDPWRIGDTYHTAIGQYAVQVTPIELARAYAAIANGGKLIKPVLVKGEPTEGESVAVDPSALQVVREGMRLGSQVGNSRALVPLESFVRTGAKTGTAQTGLHNEFTNLWVAGFFPYEKPKYVFVVVMDHGPSANEAGGIHVMFQVLSELHETAPEYFE